MELKNNEQIKQIIQELKLRVGEKKEFFVEGYAEGHKKTKKIVCVLGFVNYYICDCGYGVEYEKEEKKIYWCSWCDLKPCVCDVIICPICEKKVYVDYYDVLCTHDLWSRVFPAKRYERYEDM